MKPETSDIVSDFKILFNLVCARHQGPIRVDFASQKIWDGVIAGQCSDDIQFLLADGLNAMLDTRANAIAFSQGTGEDLHRVLVERLGKAQEAAL